MFILLKGFLFVILTSFAECRVCFDKELYRPCECYRFNFNEKIICNSIEDADKTFRALNKTFNVIIEAFINDEESESIRENIFGDVPVKYATFDTPKLKYLSNSSFNGQKDTMEFLYFYSPNLEYIPYQGQMMKLNSFWFLHNEAVTIVKKIWFTGIKNGNVLQALFIIYSAIQSIEKYAFSELVALRDLNLNHNRLSALDSSIIATNLPLLDIDIRENRLTKLPVDLLKLLPDSASIDIRQNNITEISTETLRLIIEKNVHVDINGNPLKCDCDWFPFINGSLTEEWKISINGNCQGPDSTKIANIRYLKPEDFSSCK